MSCGVLTASERRPGDATTLQERRSGSNLRLFLRGAANSMLVVNQVQVSSRKSSNRSLQQGHDVPRKNEAKSFPFDGGYPCISTKRQARLGTLSSQE
jgi:hypothetical protein